MKSTFFFAQVVIKDDTSVRLEKVYNLTVANTHNYFVGEDGVLVHNCKRARRNAHLAGQKHPVTDIPFDKEGYPDFSSISEKDVQINFTGNRSQDFREANKAAGFSKTPDGYTWHHHQDRKTMQLVPRDIHAKTGHDGGFSGK